VHIVRPIIDWNLLICSEVEGHTANTGLVSLHEDGIGMPVVDCQYRSNTTPRSFVNPHKLEDIDIAQTTMAVSTREHDKMQGYGRFHERTSVDAWHVQ
jgi:hypothetical protein